MEPLQAHSARMTDRSWHVYVAISSMSGTRSTVRVEQSFSKEWCQVEVAFHASVAVNVAIAM